jgi:predicted TIM-barrel fold metal-dependent hydrolase
MSDRTELAEVIDADGHVQEPADLWERYIDRRFHPYRPLIDQQATDNMMVVAGRALPRIMLGTPATEEYRSFIRDTWNKAFESEFSKGVDGFSARWYLDAMASEGIDRMVLYPSRGLYMCAVDDLDDELALAIAKAYNRWLIDFCRHDETKLLPVAVSTLHDPERAARQLEQDVAEYPYVAVMVRPNPVRGRNLDDPANDVFWAAAESLGLAVATHGGTGVWMEEWGPDRFRSHLAQHAISHPLEAMQAVYCFTAGGILERFPALRVAFLEAGGTWLPFWLHRLDEHVEQLRDVDSEAGHVTKLPSEHFRSSCWIGCEYEEPNVQGLVDFVGADRLVWASDFPHPDGKYPGMVDALVSAFRSAGISDEAMAGYAGGNAKNLYRLG